ncbi:hypothetical protein HanPSC8_Chr15g0646421 [Helianthus annuus]|nr:hypothetical protein HanPSC8_Chr15g0646421 [Helianthus annuus]
MFKFPINQNQVTWSTISKYVLHQWTRIIVLIKSPKKSVCNLEKRLTPLSFFNGGLL